MSTPAPVTVIRGRPSGHPRTPETTGDVDCCRTDDGQLLLVLPGDRPTTATEIATSIGLRAPAIEIYDRWDTVTVPTAAHAPDTAAAFQVWITMTTTVDQQRPLAEFNTHETRSRLRYLPGFRSATVFLSRDRPTVTEHVSWESEQHYTAATRRPDFAENHLGPIADMTSDTSWQRLWPCPRAPEGAHTRSV